MKTNNTKTVKRGEDNTVSKTLWLAVVIVIVVAVGAAITAIVLTQTDNVSEQASSATGGVAVYLPEAQCDVTGVRPVARTGVNADGTNDEIALNIDNQNVVSAANPAAAVTAANDTIELTRVATTGDAALLTNPISERSLQADLNGDGDISENNILFRAIAEPAATVDGGDDLPGVTDATLGTTVTLGAGVLTNDYPIVQVPNGTDITAGRALRINRQGNCWTLSAA